MENKIRWSAETTRVEPRKVQILRGETVELDIGLEAYRSPVELPPTASATAYWRTDDMAEGAYYSCTSGVSLYGNRVRWSFTPECDCNASAYDFFVGVDDGHGRTYRPCGRIEMLGAPGNGENILPLPTPSIDFSKVKVANAPWLPLSGGNMENYGMSIRTNCIVSQGGPLWALDTYSGDEYIEAVVPGDWVSSGDKVLGKYNRTLFNNGNQKWAVGEGYETVDIYAGCKAGLAASGAAVLSANAYTDAVVGDIQRALSAITGED